MAEKVQEISGQELSETILGAREPVLVDFWAAWCGPCRMLAPVLEELAAELAGQVKVVKVNVDENRDLASKFQIMSIPTLVLFKEGKEATRLTGYMSKEQLQEELAQYL